MRGHPPSSTQLKHFGHDLTIAAPPLASTCLSLFVLLTQPNEPRYTPGAMSEYVGGRTFSERMDNEWFRLVMCQSINSFPVGLSGALFTPSGLIGSWRGMSLVRLPLCLRHRALTSCPEPIHPQVPHLVPFGIFLLSNRNQHAVGTPMDFIEWKMELREHHCLSAQGFLQPAQGPDEHSDNPLEAWIPRDATFEEQNVSIIHSLLKNFSLLPCEKWRSEESNTNPNFCPVGHSQSP